MDHERWKTSGIEDAIVDDIERELLQNVAKRLRPPIDWDELRDNLEMKDLAPWRAATRKFIRRIIESA